MKLFLKIDYSLQSLLLIGMGLSLVMFPISMMLLLFFGAWQLISGLITAFFYKPLNRDYYLAKSIGYIALLLIGTELVDNGFLENLETVLFFIFWIIIPLGIGVWYYLMVRRDYNTYCKLVPDTSLGMEESMSIGVEHN